MTSTAPSPAATTTPATTAASSVGLDSCDLGFFGCGSYCGCDSSDDCWGCDATIGTEDFVSSFEEFFVGVFIKL